jgi:hypothetical protein
LELDGDAAAGAWHHNLNRKGHFMRQLLISGLVVIATVSTAAALDRYPTKKRYVNQTGQVVIIGQTSQVLAYAEVQVRNALPPVQTVPVAEAQRTVKPAPKIISANATSRRGLIGAINSDPANWPSGRKCCRPGEPYFNEEPNS